MCTNTEYMRPRVSKELFLSESEKLPLWHFVVAHNYNLGQNKMEQQTPSPPNHRWSRTKGKNTPFFHLWFGGEGGGQGFPFILSKIVAIPLKIFRVLKCHGYEFIFKKERHLLDRKKIITFMIFVHLCPVLSALQTGMTVQQVQSWTRARIVLRLNLC